MARVKIDHKLVIKTNPVVIKEFNTGRFELFLLSIFLIVVDFFIKY